jgi:hypothetical protein
VTTSSLLDRFAGDPSLATVQENSSWKSVLATFLVLASLVAITLAQTPVAVELADARADVRVAMDAPEALPAP